MPTIEETQTARSHFPCGLIQPEGSYRFGLDALLLAAFALKLIKPSWLIGELGSGCGAASLALSLRNPDLFYIGFEREPELVQASRKNTHLLGMTNQVSFIQTNLPLTCPYFNNRFNLVIANPPWRKGGHPPTSTLRKRALMCEEDTLSIFCESACRLLQNKGYFCILLLPELLNELFMAFKDLSLGLRKILPITSFANKPAARAICLLQKNAASSPQILPPLILRKHTLANQSEWTKESFIFCPWLK